MARPSETCSGHLPGMIQSPHRVSPPPCRVPALGVRLERGISWGHFRCSPSALQQTYRNGHLYKLAICRLWLLPELGSFGFYLVEMPWCGHAHITVSQSTVLGHVSSWLSVQKKLPSQIDWGTQRLFRALSLPLRTPALPKPSGHGVLERHPYL